MQPKALLGAEMGRCADNAPDSADSHGAGSLPPYSDIEDAEQPNNEEPEHL